jgi:uncharacterized membrane protein
MTAYHRYVGLAIVAIALLAGMILAAIIDGPVPIHWDAQGRVDGYMEQPWGLMVLPGVMLGLFLVFQVIEFISPRGFRLGSFSRVVGIFQNAVLLFLALVFAAQLLYTAGIEVAMGQLIMLGTGTLFIIIGNFLGKTRKNFFIGIRTPWTLASDEVWIRTHRLGGWVFVACGAVLLGSSFFTASPWFMLPVVISAALIPVVYSFIAYMRLEGFADD